MATEDRNSPRAGVAYRHDPVNGYVRLRLSWCDRGSHPEAFFRSTVRLHVPFKERIFDPVAKVWFVNASYLASLVQVGNAEGIEFHEEPADVLELSKLAISQSLQEKELVVAELSQKPTTKRWIVAVVGTVLLSFTLSPYSGFAPLICLIVFITVALRVRQYKRTFLVGAFLLLFLAAGVFHHVFLESPPTALCRDGSYSYSQHHQGTCSWHHGVVTWNPVRIHWWQSS